MKKAFVLIILIFLVLCTDSTNIRVRIATGSFIQLHGNNMKVRAKGKGERVISGNISISSASNGITVFYGEERDDVQSVTVKGSSMRIKGNYYSGQIKILKYKGKISAIQKLDLEEYVAGVVPGEMPVSWNTEALKAQAILARTFGYYHILKKRSVFDLGSTTNYQIYKGNVNIPANITRIVKETESIVATYKGYPIVIFYHSTCGGYTESSENLWGKGFPYLSTVECTYCMDSPRYEWEYSLTMDDFTEVINKSCDMDAPFIKDIGHSGKSKAGRVKKLIFQGPYGEVCSMSGKDFRALMGANKLKSLFITGIELDGYNVIFSGRGYGHGVGMCQYGANRLAELGHGHKYILEFYFRGIELKKISQLKK